MDLAHAITSRNAAASALAVYFGQVADVPSVFDDLRSERPILDVLRDVGDLRSAADTALNHLVRAARESGASWAQIADELHMSKQAAHERWRYVDGL